MGLLGFTFGFGARDQGLRSSFGAASNSLKEIGSQVSHLGSIAKNVTLGTMLSGFNMAAVSHISEGMDKITGGAVNITNSLESTMAASRKAAKVIGAQQGLAGKDLAKFSSSSASIAYGMNLGIDQVAKGMKTFQGLNAGFRKGLQGTGKSLKSFLKAEEATGISSEDLLRVLDGMGGSFKYTGEEAGNFLDKFTATALAGGQGSVAFGTLKQNVDDLRTSLQANSAFLALDAGKQKAYVEKQILGVQRLAGALSKTFEMIPAEAQAASADFAKNLNENGMAIQKMVAGVGDDYGGLFKTIAQEAGGLDAATVFVGESPDDAMKALVKLREHLTGMGAAGKSGLDRINIAFQELVPNLQVGLLDTEKSEKMVSNLDSITKAADNSKNAFTKFGNAAYSSGLTAADGVERAKAAFETMLGAVGGGTGAFATEQVKGYQGAADAVKKLASDETWGPLTKRFAIASRIGVSGFLLPMREEGEALATQMKKVGEAAGEGGFSGRLKAIQQLGFAGVFFDMSKGVNDTAGAMDAAQSKAQILYEKFTILKTLKDAFIPVLIALAGAIGAVVGSLKLFSIAKDALMGILSPIASVTKALFQLTLSAVGFAAAIIGWPATLFIAIVAFIAIWQALPQQIKDEIDKMLVQAAGFIDKLTVSLMAFDGEAFANKILDVLDGVALSIKAFFSGEELAAGVDDSGAKKFGIALGTFMTTAWQVVKETVGTLLKGMWEDPEIRKYITIPLGVALVAGALPKIAAMINSVANSVGNTKLPGMDGNVGGLVDKKMGKIGTAIKEKVFTGGAAGKKALEALNFAKSEAAVANSLLKEATILAASATGSALVGAQASAAAGAGLVTQTTAAVTTAQTALAGTSWYAGGMAAGSTFLSGIGTAFSVTGAAAVAAGAGIVAFAVASVAAGVVAVTASPEVKKALSKSTEVLIKGATVSLEASAKGLEAAGPSIGRALANAMSSGGKEVEAGSMWQKVKDGMSFLFEDIGQQVTDAFVNFDLSAAAIEFIQGVFSEDNFATATQAIDWGDLAMGAVEGIGSTIVTVLGGGGFVLEMIGALLIKLIDGVGAIIIVVVGLLVGGIITIVQKALMSLLTFITQGTELVARGMDMVLDLLPDSWTGGVGGWWSDLAEGASNLTDKIIDKQGQRARDAAASAAEVAAADTEARNILIANKKANAEAFAKYNDDNKVEMLSKMGVDVEKLNEQQLSILNAKLAAATEEYGKSGKDFSERAAQRLLAGVAKGFEKEINTASGIMLGMGVDESLTPAEIEERAKGFVAEFDAGVRAALEAQNISFDVLTDAQRKTMKDQGIQFTELTDEQREYFASQMAYTANKMAADGDEFTDEVKATLAKSILDAFETKAAIDKRNEILRKLAESSGKGMSLLPDAEPTQSLATGSQDTEFMSSEGSVILQPDAPVDAVSKLTGDAFAAGKSALTATAGGLLAGVPLVGDAIGTALDKLVEYVPGRKKKAKKGPLVNVADGGVQIMAEIARGMVEGTTMMIIAMDDAMTAVNKSMIDGMAELFNNMSNAFTLVGMYASNAFTSGVLLQQDLQMGELKKSLEDLFLGEFAGSLQVVDVSGAGGATLTVDTVKTLSDQIALLRDQTVAQLKLIQSNTLNTAENTKNGRGTTIVLGGETKGGKVVGQGR